MTSGHHYQENEENLHIKQIDKTEPIVLSQFSFVYLLM